MKQITVTINEETIEKIVNEIERRVSKDVNPYDYKSDKDYERACHDAKVNMLQGAYSTIVSMVSKRDLADIWNAFDAVRASK